MKCWYYFKGESANQTRMCYQWPVKLLKPLCLHKKGKKARQFQQNKMNCLNDISLQNPIKIWNQKNGYEQEPHCFQGTNV